MIFITLGSSKQNFTRLLAKIDDLASKKVLKDIIVQTCNKEYTPKNYQIIQRLSLEEYNKYMKECTLLITHGGVGSILDGLNQNKKIIAFPRLKEYHEAVNDHQNEFVSKFAQEGYILTGEIDDLEKLLTAIKEFTPRKFKSNNAKFNIELIKTIEKY